MDDNAADVLSIHKVLIALINFVTPGPASTTTPAPSLALGGSSSTLILCPYSWQAGARLS